MSPRVSIVLGSGGPVGHAFAAGALRALEEVLGWDPRAASLLVGTSAGAQVAALLRAGMSAADLDRRVRGEPLTEAGDSIAAHYVRPSHERKRARQWHRPSSPEYLQRVALRPWQGRLTHFVSALLPSGDVCLEPQASGLRRVFSGGWSADPMWIVAVDLHSGARVVFGAHDAPSTDVGTAVACSGAVPGVCEPIVIEGRHYVDGGIQSSCHADLLVGAEQDVAFVINPLSLFPPLRLMLRREVRALKRRGDPLVLIEPDTQARRVMGLNPMATDRGPSVADEGARCVRDVLLAPQAMPLLRDLF